MATMIILGLLAFIAVTHISTSPARMEAPPYPDSNLRGSPDPQELPQELGAVHNTQELQPTAAATESAEEVTVLRIGSLILRFDILLKATYARHVIKYGSAKVPKYTRDLYLTHIGKWNKFKERCKFGDDHGAAEWKDTGRPCVEKTSSDDFLNSFHATIASITTKGFDSSASLVPVNDDLFPLNGAHRVATALALDLETMPVQIVKTATAKRGWYTWETFEGQGLPKHYGDYATLQWVLNDKRATVITYWPQASEAKDKELRDKVREECSVLDGIIYTKKVQLTEAGVRSLVFHAYGEQPWLEGKARQLWGNPSSNPNEKRTVKFQFIIPDATKTATCKDKMRSFFDLKPHPKSSVHIPDRHEEVVIMAEMALNANSVYYMNNHVETKGDVCRKVAMELATRVPSLPEVNPQLRLFPQDMMIDSGAVMGYFGMRLQTDADILYEDAIDEAFLGDVRGLHVEAHPFESNKRGNERAWGQPHLGGSVPTAIDLFNDPGNYGFCHGLKFVALEQLVRYKERRNDSPKNNPGKDAKDAATVKAFIAAHK